MSRKVDKRIKQFCPRGHDTFVVGRDKSMGRCLECVRIYHIELRKKNPEKAIELNRKSYKKNKDKVNRRAKRWRKANAKFWKEYVKQYAIDHKEKIAARAKNYFQINKKKILKYRRKHPEIYKLALLKQNKKRKLRIPKFGQVGIRKFYANCPKNKEVDHVIPLLGKKVSGLHVRWNLQYLTKLQNTIKNNKADLIKISEDYGKLLEKLGLKDKQKK